MIPGGVGQEGDRGRRWLHLLAAAVGVIAGVVAAVRLRREITGEWLVALLGVPSVVAGVLLLGAGWRLRKANVVVLRI
jgi:uncharacterized membrane protein HdeD (DUF308 family)